MSNKIIFDYIRIIIVLLLLGRVLSTPIILRNEQAIGEFKPSPSAISSIPASLDLFHWLSLVGEQL